MRTFTYECAASLKQSERGAANRLTSVTSGTLTTTFEYDGLPAPVAQAQAGNRVAQTAGGVTTEYVLDVAGGLPEVIVATTGGASTRYVQVQGQVLAQQDTGAWAYVLPDHLGSVRQLVDSDGRVSLAQSFDPFGVLNSQHGTPNPQLPFGYTGEQEDPSTGLVFLRARYYDPVIGRFLTRDSWQGDSLRPLSMNGYLYSGANPANLFDPSGYSAEDPCVPSLDGYMEGISLSYGGLLSYFSELAAGQRQPDEIYFKYSIAVEWVYDFPHKQMALFEVAGQTFERAFGKNILNVDVSMGTTTYQGIIDGFRNYPDVNGYSGPFWVRGFGAEASAFLFGFGYSQLEANPSDTYMTDLQDTWMAEVDRDRMSVKYSGFSAALGSSINSLGSLSVDLSGNLSMGSSVSDVMNGPITLASSEQMARIIEQGLNSFPIVADFLGRRVTYLNPLLIPKRKKAVEVLRTYF